MESLKERCKAEEWQRDGRGLWAWRYCLGPVKHGARHSFSAWEYNVQPPEREASEALGVSPPAEELSDGEISRRLNANRLASSAVSPSGGMPLPAPPASPSLPREGEKK